MARDKYLRTIIIAQSPTRRELSQLKFRASHEKQKWRTEEGAVTGIDGFNRGLDQGMEETCSQELMGITPKQPPDSAGVNLSGGPGLGVGKRGLKELKVRSFEKGG